jgi:hypothetical protein
MICKTRPSLGAFLAQALVHEAAVFLPLMGQLAGLLRLTLRTDLELNDTL